jgi:hypothetical protein
MDRKIIMCDYCKPPAYDSIDDDFPAKEIEACDENAGEPILPVKLHYIGDKLFSVRMAFEYGYAKAETEQAEEYCNQLCSDLAEIFTDFSLTDSVRQKLMKTLKARFGISGNLFEFNYCPICGRSLEGDK